MTWTENMFTMHNTNAENIDLLEIIMRNFTEQEPCDRILQGCFIINKL